MDNLIHLKNLKTQNREKASKKKNQAINQGTLLILQFQEPGNCLSPAETLLIQSLIDCQRIRIESVDLHISRNTKAIQVINRIIIWARSPNREVTREETSEGIRLALPINNRWREAPLTEVEGERLREWLDICLEKKRRHGIASVITQSFRISANKSTQMA